MLSGTCLFVVLTLCFNIVQSYYNCPDNQEFVDCVNPCNTCEQKGRCIELSLCHPGCDCKHGFFKNGKGKCIPESHCQMDHTHCPKNSVFSPCGLECEPTCENPFGEDCTKCVPGCVCAEGFLKNEDGKCVSQEHCDYIPDECGDYEQYYWDCTPRCRNTCENFNNHGVQCECDPPGCFCAEGFLKRSDGKCVKPEQCHTKPGKCRPPEKFYAYMPDCRNTCENYNNPDVHCSHGLPGCFCKEDMVKNEDGKCVYPRECHEKPPSCPDKSVYILCGPNCPPTCENRYPGKCEEQCVPGCYCIKGYLESKGRCVPENECDAKEPPEKPPSCPDKAVYISCGPACPPTCENRYPGKCEEQCVPGCYCIKGYLESKGRCVPENECDAKEPPAKCASDEQYYEYMPSCKNTCENYNNHGVHCVPGPPGCFCKEGLVKRKDGKCVKTEECLVNPPRNCSENEVFTPCGPACPATCMNKYPPPCKEPCVPDCYCKPGFLRNNNHKCVHFEDCEPKSKCPPDEQYYQYMPNCKNTCENYNNPGVRCTAGPPGCFCKEGLVKRKDGKCVKLKECPAKPPPNCPENEVFIPCGPACPPTCMNKYPLPCNKPCVSSCFCKPGYLRDKKNKCVHFEDCEPKIKCLPDEQFYEYMPSCRKTCENHNNFSVLCPRGSPGCFCKEGLVKRKDGRCVHPRRCLGRCLPYQQYYEHTPNCKNTCENHNSSVVCALGPPGCFCRKGLVKRKDGRCVLPRRCIENKPKCHDYAVFMYCGTACPPTCKDPYPGPCTKPCVPRCMCIRGYLQDEYGNCVRPDQCKQAIKPIVPYCPNYAVFLQCGTACPATCKDPYPGPCTKPCIPGCVCIRGYLQNEHGKCVQPEQCSHRCRIPDEEFLECGTGCPDTCENKGYPNPITCHKCVRGCFCKKGYFRTKEGACVRLEDCPQLIQYIKPTLLPPKITPKCHENAVFQWCATACPATCQNPNPKPCPHPCIPGCDCKQGFLLDDRGKCIAINDCSKCRIPHEEYLECGTSCQYTCENKGNPDPITCHKCVRGCFCKKGYFRTKEGACVRPEDCPQLIQYIKKTQLPPTSVPVCPDNAVFMQCGTACPVTCKEPFTGPCTKPCTPRCVCNKGYLQNEDGKCVRFEQCKPRCRVPDEEFLECGTSCPDTCENKGHPDPITCNKCVRGCFCKKGLFRTKHGACILLEDCSKIIENIATSQLPIVQPPKCQENARFYQCASACPQTCVNPATRHCTKPCIPRCVCNPGYVEKSDGKCVVLDKCVPRKTDKVNFNSSTLPKMFS